MNKLTELRNQLQELNTKIANFELDPDNYTDLYDNVLNECNEEFMGFQPSAILKSVDPIQYRCGLLDYVDGWELDDDVDYMDLIDERDELKTEIEELEEAEDEE